MRNILIVGIIALFLVGCSSTPKKINVVTTPIEKLKLNLVVLAAESLSVLSPLYY